MLRGLVRQDTRLNRLQGETVNARALAFAVFFVTANSSLSAAQAPAEVGAGELGLRDDGGTLMSLSVGWH